MHILILGGTTEANALADLAHRAKVNATLSLAGRTERPVLPAIAHRIGGFGGAMGLAQWMQAHRVSALIDATHPFAARMPWNAAEAAAKTGIPLLTLTRPAWTPGPGDRWTEAADHAAALAAIGPVPRRIFLTVGRLELAAYTATPHRYLIRTIDPVAEPMPGAIYIAARGPFSVESERALMQQHAINALVSKNSGGSATGAKLAAARELGIPVFLIRRPPRPKTNCAQTAGAAMRWIAEIHSASV